MVGFLFIAFLIFSGALLGAGYYTWTVPQRQANHLLVGRLRELRARSGGARTRSAPDLVVREKESAFAFLGKFLDWFQSETGRGILIIGPGGVGKTTLAAILSGKFDWFLSES